MKYIKNFENKSKEYVVVHFYKHGNDDNCYYIFELADKITKNKIEYLSFYYYENNELHSSINCKNYYNNYNDILNILYKTNDFNDAHNYLKSILYSNKYNL